MKKVMLVFGTRPEEKTIYTEFKKLLTDKDSYDVMACASNPYGDGYACKRIADIISAE